QSASTRCPLLTNVVVISIARNLTGSRDSNRQRFTHRNMVCEKNAHALLLTAAGKVGARAVELHSIWKHDYHVFHGREHRRFEGEASRIRKVIANLKLRVAGTDWEHVSVTVLLSSRNWTGVDGHAARTSRQ